MTEKLLVRLTVTHFDGDTTTETVPIDAAIELDRRLLTGKPKPLHGVALLYYTMPEIPDDDDTQKT